jgi:hypothetical protein
MFYIALFNEGFEYLGCIAIFYSVEHRLKVFSKEYRWDEIAVKLVDVISYAI